MANSITWFFWLVWCIFIRCVRWFIRQYNIFSARMEAINAYYVEHATIVMWLFVASSIVIACCGMATPDKQVCTLDFEAVIFWIAICLFMGIAFPHLFAESIEMRALKWKAGIVQ
jgi:quinol-cytochrome oxidoreductase complex cytochrome b subunit